MGTRIVKITLGYDHDGGEWFLEDDDLDPQNIDSHMAGIIWFKKSVLQKLHGEVTFEITVSDTGPNE